MYFEKLYLFKGISVKTLIENKDLLTKAILSLETPEEVYELLIDLTTERELAELSNRFRIAKMLKDNYTFKEIEQETKASSATISRVSRCLKNGTGYRKSLLNLEKNAEQNA